MWYTRTNDYNVALKKKKKGNPTIWDNMGVSWEHYATWNVSVIEGHMSHDSIAMWCLK